MAVEITPLGVFARRKADIADLFEMPHYKFLANIS
jgi:hypothetical protein